MKTLNKYVCIGLAISGLMLSGVVSAGHSWGGYHWERSSNPLALDLGRNVTGDWNAHLDEASVDWSASTVLDTTIISGSTTPRKCRVETGNVQVCNANYGNNGWLGIASISISGGHITAGYVKVNDTYFDLAAYNTYEWKQFVMCQEIGHTFGLSHQDENFNNANLGSCMDYTSSPLENIKPNTHDYGMLVDIYTHEDTTNVGGGGGGGGGGCKPAWRCGATATAVEILSEIEMNGPQQWGRLVSDPGLQEVYELDFGGGRKVITHVIWTLEAASKRQKNGN